MKGCPTSYVKKIPIKAMRHSTHLLEWLESGTPATPNAGKDVE